MYIDDTYCPTLPETVMEKLASHKYAICVRTGERLSDDWTYAIALSTAPIVIVPASESGLEYDSIQSWSTFPMTAGVSCLSLVYSPLSDSEWSTPETISTPVSINNFTVVWSNHDVHFLKFVTTTNDDGEEETYGIHTSEVYFEKNGILFSPMRMSVDYFWMKDVADQVRRLRGEGTTEYMPLEMPSALEELSVISDLVNGTITTFNGISVTTVRSNAFSGCATLTEATLPSATAIQSNAFDECIALTTVEAPAVTSIESLAFNGCTAFANLVLEGSTVCVLASTDAFTGTLIESGTGKIWVKTSLVDTYKAAENWSSFADQIYDVADYE